MKKVLSLILSVFMFVSFFASLPFTADANNNTYDLNFDVVQSGQLNNSTSFYKFSLPSYTTLTIDYDSVGECYDYRQEIFVIAANDYNDYIIGKNVNKYFSVNTEKSGNGNYWYDGNVSLCAGTYYLCIYIYGVSVDYSLTVTPTVINPVVTCDASCQSVNLKLKSSLGTQRCYIEQLIDSEYVNIKTIDSSISLVEIDGLNPETTYYFRVKGYTEFNGKKYYSDWININIATKHTLLSDSAVTPSCTENGKTAGSHCLVCGAILTEQTIIAAKGHDFGNNNTTCLVCGVANPNYVAPQPTTQPTQPTTPPTEQAPEGAEKVDGEWVAKKQKNTKITKLKKGKKSFKAIWKKVSSVNGYQIQYATDKKFKKNKKNVTIKGNKSKKPSKTIKKLKAKKTYYVRVRTYKTVKVNGKATKVYSSWSKIKPIKTK